MAEYSAAILYGAASIWGGLFLARAIELEGYAKLIVVIVCGVAGFWLGAGKKANFVMSALLTAGVGSFMVIYGVARETGMMSDGSLTKVIVIISFGVILTIVCSVVQIKCFRDMAVEFEDADGDGVNDKDVMDDEEGRICGLI